jgi:membrane-associated phospholipid phosphatase
VLPTVRAHFWFKCLGTMGFTLVFFSAYIYLLKNPGAHVLIMPLTAMDDWVGFEPWALSIYFSLWVYVSLPPMFMLTRIELIKYGIWIGSLCLFALGIFYLWPTAVPPSMIDWAQYPGMAFLKDVDAAGNACPSLHVATAVFSAFWLHWLLPSVGLGQGARCFSAIWCIGIIYSTMATKQHVAVDVLAGACLGITFSGLSKLATKQRMVALKCGHPGQPL